MDSTSVGTLSQHDDDDSDLEDLRMLEKLEGKNLIAQLMDESTVPRSRIFHERPPSSESHWFLEFLEDPKGIYKHAQPGSGAWIEYQHRFRMQFRDVKALYKLAMTKRWFPEYDEPNLDKRLKRKHSLKLLILTALATLAGVASFKLICDGSLIPAGTTRVFFDLFCSVGSKEMTEEFIVMPLEKSDLEHCEAAYKAAGFPGCIGSVDGVRIRIWRCPYTRRHDYIGKERYTALTFIVVVAYDGRVLYCSEQYRGSQPDIDIATEDPLFEQFSLNNALQNFEWHHVTATNEVKTRMGARLLSDAGFPDLPFLTMPSKSACTVERARFDRVLESLRKDVERAFGDVKQRFPMLRTGITTQRLAMCGKIVRTCFAIRNFILSQNPRLLRKEPLEANEALTLRLREAPTFVSAPLPKRQRVVGPSEVRKAMVEHFNVLFTAKLLRWPKLVISRKEDFDDDSDTDDSADEFADEEEITVDF